MDIRVCLASFLLQMGRYAEAIEAADSILDKLTYCLEAIRVMAAATEKLGKPEQGFIYLQRWCELDPYAQFIESMQQDVADIPDQRVLLDWPNEYPEPPHGLEKPPEPGPAKQAAPRERPGEETLADSLNWLYEEEPPSLAVNQPIEKARLAFQKGELEESLFIYQGMVLAGHSLEEVVSDLSQAVESRPSAGAWQVLGDALMRLGREDEAMQAYTNAVNLAKP
jgi:tetratricopeptide (TPR) repeat protein